jgi:hypothetical protein
MTAQHAKYLAQPYDDIINDIFVRFKIYKQISAIGDSAKTSTLMRFLETALENIRRKNPYLTYANPANMSDRQFLDYLIKKQALVFEAFVIGMDIYTVARSLRRYIRVPGKTSGRAKNIFIYAGDRHITNYIDIYKTLGMTVAASVGG